MNAGQSWTIGNLLQLSSNEGHLKFFRISRVKDTNLIESRPFFSCGSWDQSNSQLIPRPERSIAISHSRMTCSQPSGYYHLSRIGYWLLVQIPVNNTKHDHGIYIYRYTHFNPSQHIKMLWCIIPSRAGKSRKRKQCTFYQTLKTKPQSVWHVLKDWQLPIGALVSRKI